MQTYRLSTRMGSLGGNAIMKTYIAYLFLILSVLFLVLTIRALVTTKTLLMTDPLLAVVFCIAFILIRRKR